MKDKKDKRPSKPKRDDQKHVMTEEEKLDETIDESFPASDPPGHYSVSQQDGKEYRE
jgi:hypothetical protein